MPFLRTEYSVSFILNQLLIEKQFFKSEVFFMESNTFFKSNFFFFKELFPVKFTIFYDVKKIEGYCLLGTYSKYLFATIFFCSSKLKRAVGIKSFIKYIKETSIGKKIKRRRFISTLPQLAVNGFFFLLTFERGFFSFTSFCLFSMPTFVLRVNSNLFWRLGYCFFFFLWSITNGRKPSFIFKMFNFWFFHSISPFFELFSIYYEVLRYGMFLEIGNVDLLKENPCRMEHFLILSLLGFSVF